MKYKAMKIRTFNQASITAGVVQKLETLGYKGSTDNIYMPESKVKGVFTMEDGEIWLTPYNAYFNVYEVDLITIEELMQMTPEDVRESPVAKGHNPDRLTEREVGVAGGWRLISEDEQRLAVKPDKRLVEQWGKAYQKWNRLSFTNSDNFYTSGTYRTRQPEGYFLTKKENSDEDFFAEQKAFYERTGIKAGDLFVSSDGFANMVFICIRGGLILYADSENRAASNIPYKCSREEVFLRNIGREV